MAKCDKLLEQARNNPRGLRFDEFVKLAECYEFLPARQRGSHLILKRDGFRNFINAQPDRNGMAKSPQVRELLDAIAAIEDG